MYTAGSGMMALQHRMDTIANNLANVDTSGYKYDDSIFKAFPELLLRRMGDDGMLSFFVRQRKIGSIDKTPVIGTLGTGVAQNEVFTVFEQGEFKQTDSHFDVALAGKGFFTVETPYGLRYTRNGSFHIDPSGILVTKEGYPVLGENGYVKIKKNNFIVDEDGKIFVNNEYTKDPQRLVAMEENQWKQTVFLDRFRIIQVEEPRYLRKQGSSLWKVTEHSGPARVINEQERPKVLQRFLEGSNVNPVTEMVRMIEVNRNYESNQKVIQSEDQSTSQLLERVLRV